MDVKAIKYIFSVFILFNFVSCGSDKRPEIPRKPVPEIPSKPLPSPLPDLPPRPDPKPAPVNYCVKPGLDFNQDGPYKVISERRGFIKIMRPEIEGCIKPIMTFCNGTGSRLFFYNKVLKRFASHGYYVSSYETPKSGSGRAALRAVEYAMKQENVAKDLVAAHGHSQGGQCVASVTYELEKKYPNILVAAIHGQPAYGMSRPDYASILPQIKSPVFAISGSRDTSVPASWVDSGFKLIKSEKYWFEAVGATHLNPHSWFATGGLAFSNMVLFDHEDARQYFFGLPDSQYWKVIYE